MIDFFENVIIFFAGLASIAGALILLFHKNPVRAALGLLLSMISIGVIYLTIGALFVGFIHLLVYAGAIVILFLFAIMHFPLGRIRRDRTPSTSIIGAVLIIALITILLGNFVALHEKNIWQLTFASGNPKDALEIGRRFINDWIYPFELIGILLLVAIVATVHLTKGIIYDRHAKGGKN